MKLLIVTQVVDTEHPILGFFHRWIEEFAAHCEHVHVICLQIGSHSLPANVTVHSLGKESGVRRIGYILNFYKLIWGLRDEYDTVFVHMNQVYVLLGGLLWRMMRKQIGLWYAHGTISNSLRVATIVAHTIFTSTAEGMRIQTKKKCIVGQGIDLTIFKAKLRQTSDTLQLITVGRISPSKNIDTLLHACALLKESVPDFTFTIVGVALTPREQAYEAQMRTLTETLGLEDQVVWVGGVTQKELPQHLQTAHVFIHDGATDSLDKTLLEAVLCGCVVVSSNPAYRTLAVGATPELLFTTREASQLANILQNNNLADISKIKSNQELQDFVKCNFSIQSLVSGIVATYNR
jgi:glycosyltransferase involved in cell wall biosynthesis